MVLYMCVLVNYGYLDSGEVLFVQFGYTVWLEILTWNYIWWLAK